MLSRMICAISLLFVGCATSLEHLDECPNPVSESMAWRSTEGVAIEVVSARVFRLRMDDGTLVEVSIANAGAPFAADAADRLRKLLDGQRVTVFTSSSRDRAETMTGEVQVGKGIDVARKLLRAGQVSFVEEPGYTLSGYSECLHRIAEREAKAARVGVWR